MARTQKTATPAPAPQTSSRTFTIPNKLQRQAHNVRIKSALAASKRKERFERKRAEAKDPSLRAARLAKNIPDTLERKRVWPESVVGAGVDKKRLKRTSGDDVDGERRTVEGEEREEGEKEGKVEEVEKEGEGEEEGETSGPFPELSIPPPQATPRILITTNRNSHIHAPAEELTALFPNSTYVPRGMKQQLSIREIASFASSPTSLDPTTGKPREPFSHVVVVNEDRKIINALTIVVLPAGPTFRFSVSNYTTARAISGHGNPTSHTPELILNNFLTPLGTAAASLFQSMFPRVPEFQGRQVVTLHNQRDYIFFRRHRYVFREKREREKEAGYGLEAVDGTSGEMKGLGVKVGLQELGPSFTLKLRKVEKGVKEGVIWEWKGRMEKNRKMFQL